MGVSDRCEMTWEKAKLRWRKMYKGKIYTVSCDTLECTPTKEGSYQAANAWWERKLAELVGEPAIHPHRAIIAESIVRPNPAVPVHSTDSDWLVEIARQHGVSIPPNLDPAVKALLFGQTRDNHAHIQAKTVNDRELDALSRRFLGNTEARMRAGDLSASEFDTAQRCVKHAVDFFGPDNEPSVINPDRWESYWKFLLAQVADKTRSREYVKKDWRYAKSFVRWMASMGKMVLPANVDERRYRFGDSIKTIPTFTLDEVRHLVEAAPGQTKLHLLLMLNAGMYQGDISELTHEEVDWANGVITRKRSKTRHQGEKIPTVSYKLWPLTFDLLKTYRSNHPELALTTKAGKLWVEPKMKGDKFTRRDGIKSNFAHIQRRLKIDKPLKVFRKTSSSLLDKHPEFGRYAQFFLGHAGRSIAERHYVVPSQERFDEAVRWLGGQYGFLQ